MRAPTAIGITCVLVFGGGGVGVAHAGPFPAPPCSFTVSAPALEAGSVSATVDSTGCAAFAAPYSSVACLQSDGSAMFCAQGQGADPARVTVPYQQGVTYTATGRGCAGWVGLPPAANCQILGPVSGTP